MSVSRSSVLRSSVLHELVLALAGIGLVGFLLVHLAGNFFIYGGPEVFNGYSEKLHGFPVTLWVARIGLIAIFALHVVITTTMWIKNRNTRAQRYAVTVRRAPKGLGTRTMIITGALIFVFVGIHLLDFTFADKEGLNSLLNGESQGLYGVVWNGFANPVRAAFYILLMCCVGLHLSHAISSLCITFGAQNERFVAIADVTAKIFGALVAIAYSSIPVYVLVQTYLLG
ncbi:MAG TPA: succinate dehydrogenase cytochrome b subunit [Candidatus Hydrogenedentes bacterium]|nr:succinate dehydrogenase cytochrome b subunit [Candidatus Hydrogenedentota bacterium]